jgi:hypothetical protein
MQRPAGSVSRDRSLCTELRGLPRGVGFSGFWVNGLATAWNCSVCPQCWRGWGPSRHLCTTCAHEPGPLRATAGSLAVQNALATRLPSRINTVIVITLAVHTGSITQQRADDAPALHKG